VNPNFLNSKIIAEKMLYKSRLCTIIVIIGVKKVMVLPL